MTGNAERSFFARPIFAMLVGLVGGLLLLLVARLESGPRMGEGIAIGINGVPPRMARDVLLPGQGWTLQVSLPIEAGAPVPDGLVVEIREERTGLTLEIQDRMRVGDGYVTYTVPESLGLYEGLLAIRATLVDDAGRRAEDWLRVRLRPWLGGPPIGARQIIHFDFEFDRDEDGRADVIQDLERLGLVSTHSTRASDTPNLPDAPDLARLVARRIAERALERVLRAYDPSDDPGRTGRARDIVTVRFVLESDSGHFVTRICVGGQDPTESGSVGHVRFDHRNARKSSQECDGEPPAGLFSSELSIYRAAPLYQDVLAPFLESKGGIPIGADPEDRALLTADAGSSHAPSEEASDPSSTRRRQIERAIRVFGDAFGTIMAHETGHALGLVAEGRPGVGLFGGAKGDGYAHNLDADGNPPGAVWLMNSGRSFSFEELAGESEAGELRFRPLNHAYLRDRVVLIDGRSKD